MRNSEAKEVKPQNRQCQNEATVEDKGIQCGSPVEGSSVAVKPVEASPVAVEPVEGRPVDVTKSEQVGERPVDDTKMKPKLSGANQEKRYLPQIMASVANRVVGSFKDSSLAILIDTGAEITVLSNDYFKSHPDMAEGPVMTGPFTTARGVDGTRFPLLGRVPVTFEMGNARVHQPMYLVDGLDCHIILGADWLLLHKAVLDFGMKALLLPQATTPSTSLIR